MLAPILSQRLGDPRLADDRLHLGRGQILGLTGKGWRDLMDGFRKAPPPPGVIAANTVVAAPDLLPGALQSLAAQSERLWLVTLETPLGDDAAGHLLAACEERAARGGGAVIGGDALALHPGMTRLLNASRVGEPGGALHDDAGAPVHFLRRGEWGALRFLLKTPLPDGMPVLRLEIEGARGERIATETVRLDPWRPFPGASVAEWEFAAPGAAGRYRARMRATGADDDFFPAEPAEFEIRDGGGFPDPGAFRARLRLLGGTGIPSRAAEMLWRERPGDRVDLSPAGGSRLGGWNNSERDEAGRWRCWTRERAEAVLAGRASHLKIALVDLRPDGAARVPTRVGLFADDEPLASFTLADRGEQVVRAPWPAGALPHRVTLSVDPCWVPATSIPGSDDRRTLGVLVREMELSDD